MKGIDISAYQSNLDFSKINCEVVFIKATEGLTYTNPYLKLHYAKAKAKGLKVGFYHFQRSNNPIDEAKHFLNAIDGLQSDCKYVIDIETDPVSASYRVKQFADYLKSKGKEPCIYTGLYFYNDILDRTVKDLPLWVAAYTKTRPIIRSVGWQYSDKETIGGVTVDHNVFDTGILLTPKVAAKPTLKTGTVTATILNVRADAGTGFKIIGTLKKGDKVTIAKAIGPNWYSIYFGDHGGYVSSEFIK